VASDGHYKPRNGVIGKARPRDASKNEGKLEVKFSNWQPVWGPYDVLYTDYENVTIINSCTSLGFWEYQTHWIMARKPLNSDENTEEYSELIDNAKQVLEANIPGFDFEKDLRATVQGTNKGCQY